MNPGEFSAFDWKISPLSGAAGEYDGVEFIAKITGAHIDANVDPGAKFGAFLLHLFDSAIDVTFFHFEFRDAVAK